mmetsp:Transcript_14352/g.32886  ORF Transcript_14352/g.32886 Transcript_14352/m.32886 type:complete len:224 (+) Transcript_14352:231-902(+)
MPFPIARCTSMLPRGSILIGLSFSLFLGTVENLDPSTKCAEKTTLALQISRFTNGRGESGYKPRNFFHRKRSISLGLWPNLITRRKKRFRTIVFKPRWLAERSVNRSTAPRVISKRDRDSLDSKLLRPRVDVNSLPSVIVISPIRNRLVASCAFRRALYQLPGNKPNAWGRPSSNAFQLDQQRSFRSFVFKESGASIFFRNRFWANSSDKLIVLSNLKFVRML